MHACACTCCFNIVTGFMQPGKPGRKYQNLVRSREARESQGKSGEKLNIFCDKFSEVLFLQAY